MRPKVRGDSLIVTSVEYGVSDQLGWWLPVRSPLIALNVWPWSKLRYRRCVP